MGGSVSLRFAPFDSNCFEVSLRSAAFDSNSIKVVTTNDVVYLLGIVTEAQASQISNTASSIGGVKKVVTLFQYVTSK